MCFQIEKLLNILKEDVLAKGDKAVIVSQWTKMLDIIANFLTAESISHKTISGQVPSKDRSGIVKQFNDPSSALKVSSSVGCGCALNSKTSTASARGEGGGSQSKRRNPSLPRVDLKLRWACPPRIHVCLNVMPLPGDC